MTVSADELLALALETAREAGQVLAEAQKGTVEVAETKSSPTDVVTAVDLESERLIRARILDRRPTDGFVGEEGADVVGNSGVSWIADPIDGTVNFLYGIPQFAVSIAAVDDGEVVAGVVHDPMSGETFTATLGGGAYCDGRPIRVSAKSDVHEALVGTGYSYRSDVREVQAQEMARLLPRVRDARRMGSAALDICYVACGRFDAYVERALRPWDVAAAALIAREAGARVEGLHGEPPGELIVAAAPQGLFEAFHDELIRAGFGDWPLEGWPPERP